MSVRVSAHIVWLASLSFCLSGCFEASPKRSVEVAKQGLYSASLSRDGSHAVVGSIYHGASLWESKGERIFNWNHTQGNYSEIVATAFSPEGAWAVTAEESNFVLWSTTSGKASAYLQLPAEPMDLAASNQADLVAAALNNNTAVVYAAKKSSLVRTLRHQDTVLTIDISDDGQLVLTGSEDDFAILWDLSTGKKVLEKRYEDDVVDVALSPSGRTAFVVAQYDKAEIWNTANGKTLTTLPLSAQRLARGSRFTTAAFSDDDRLLLTGRPDQIVQLWSAETGKLLETWKLPKRDAWRPTSASVLAVSFAKQKGVFYAVASNGYLHELRQ